jgi:hypothetical protein
MPRCITDMTCNDHDEWDVDEHVYFIAYSGNTTLLQGSPHHPRIGTRILLQTFSTMSSHPRNLRCFKDTPKQIWSTNLSITRLIKP